MQYKIGETIWENTYSNPELFITVDSNFDKYRFHTLSELILMGATPLDEVEAGKCECVCHGNKSYLSDHKQSNCVCHKTSPKQDEEIEKIDTPDTIYVGYHNEVTDHKVIYDPSLMRWISKVTSAINKLQRGE